MDTWRCVNVLAYVGLPTRLRGWWLQQGPEAATTLAGTPKPAASAPEIRALCAALCCCGSVTMLLAFDVRIADEALGSFGEVSSPLRLCWS